MSSTSGIPGITWEAQRRKWKLRIGGKYIGLYDTVEEAAAAKAEITQQQPVVSVLQSLRRSAGLTQTELAEEIGITPVMLSYWERGHRDPLTTSADRFNRMARALHIEPAKLAEMLREERDSKPRIRMPGPSPSTR